MLAHKKILQPLADHAAIGLSMLCVVHCLALPVVATLLPPLLAVHFADERFHLWLIVFVIPLSVLALTLGCRKHRNTSVVYLGALGIVFLCLAPFFGHDLLGDYGEQILTLTGAGLIAISHVKNFLLCRREDHCECPEANA